MKCFASTKKFRREQENRMAPKGECDCLRMARGVRTFDASIILTRRGPTTTVAENLTRRVVHVN